MKIAIDVHHIAEYNFFRNSLDILIDKGIDIELIVRSRGSIVPIIKKELPNFPLKILGEHQSSIHRKISEGIKRELELLFYLKKIKCNVGVGCGFEICYASQIMGKPSIVFVDDYEYKIPFYLAKFAATKFFMPDSIPVTGKNIFKYKGFKELAYLHPNYFKPNKKILENYDLKANEFVFIREIANTSLNYLNASSKLHEITQYLKDMGFQIIVSLEDRSQLNNFKDCFVLKEPVEDINSLMSFAALTISSGDTMARESCLVGTPTIYTGGREMSVNKELIENQCMFKIDDFLNIKPAIKYICDNNLKTNVTDTIKYNINHNWGDVTEVIVKNIMNLIS